MESIVIEKIIRTKRKSLSIVISQDGTVLIRAPLRTPDQMIENFIREKRAWIEKKIQEMKKRPRPVKRAFVNGESILYLGKYYEIQVLDDPSITIELRNKLYISQRILPDVRRHLKAWYKAEARKKIFERVAFFSEITGYLPKSIKISRAERRWGSCTSKGTLNFSWRLIMAPLEMIDYVIVHEMVHLDQPDHSKAFWNKVRVIMPDYERRKNWLKENDRLLVI